nr:MAG TPA: hypothetical protein [Caudoviricetes sp.]
MFSPHSIIKFKNHFKEFFSRIPSIHTFQSIVSSLQVFLYWNSAIDINGLCQNRTDLSCYLVSPPEYE